MQYYQLQYIIKILLLNGLFVLFSHAMEKNKTPIHKVNTVINLTLNTLQNPCLPTKKRKRNQSDDKKSKISNKKQKNIRCIASIRRNRKRKCMGELRMAVDGVNETVAICKWKEKYDTLHRDNERTVRRYILLLEQYNELKRDTFHMKKRIKANTKLPVQYNELKRDTFRMKKRVKANAKKYLDALEALESKIDSIKKELKESNESKKDLCKQNSELKNKVGTLKTNLVGSQVANFKLQKQYNDAFLLYLTKQDSVLFPNYDS